MSRARGRSGFSLLEMMAVVLLTSIVMGAALTHYVTLSRTTQRASEHTRDVRRAAAILDRIARDFESAFIVQTPEEQDPLENGYFFWAESLRSELGADRLKFVTRAHSPRRTASHESDVETVGYVLREGEAGDLELLRWSSPRVPEGYDPRVPTTTAEGAYVLAEGLAAFGVRLIDETGVATSRWDSSQLERSGQLPLAVEIELALADPEGDEPDPERYLRRVLLPVRPLDLQELLDPTSLVSGGLGGDDQLGEGDTESDSDEPELLALCRQSPCANANACDVINCQANLGRISPSVDIMLRRELSNPRTFCSFMGGYGLKTTLLARLGVPQACTLR